MIAQQRGIKIIVHVRRVLIHFLVNPLAKNAQLATTVIELIKIRKNAILGHILMKELLPAQCARWDIDA